MALRIILDWCSFLAHGSSSAGAALAPLLVRAIGQGDERALRETVAAGVPGLRRRISLAMVVVGMCLGVIGRAASGLGPAGTADLRLAWAFGLLGFLGWVSARCRRCSRPSSSVTRSTCC